MMLIPIIGSLHRAYSFANAEAAAVVNAFSVPVNYTRKAAIDAFVGALKTGGIWSKKRVIQVYRCHAQADCVINWKNPGTYNATLVNSPTFTVNGGVAGDASSKYVDTGFNPNSDGGGLYQQDDAGIEVVAEGGTDTDASVMLCGVADGSNAMFLRPRVGGNFNMHLNSFGGSGSPGASSTRLGFTAIGRTSSSSVEGWRDGSAIGTASLDSSGVPDASVYVCGYNNEGSLAGACDNRIGLFSAGARLTDTEKAAYRTAWLNWVAATP